MIGVVAPLSAVPVVREFFELFKTPWQMHSPGCRCDVLLCFDSEVPASEARLVLVFGPQEQPVDRTEGWTLGPVRDGLVLSRGSDRLPLYSACRTFRDAESSTLVEESSTEIAALEKRCGEQKVVRIGYDLTAEVRYLLTQGQPRTFARIPTLDLHIAFVRELIVAHGVPLTEIPPVPEGYNFIACLTHDVDHPRVRNHCCDHTMFGFVVRALFGSVFDWMRGRFSFQQVAGCYRAAFSLPFVYGGWAPDFWNLFVRYREIEKEARSTFFVIPKRGVAGRDAKGRQPAKRAGKYSLPDIQDDLRELVSAGGEVAVHGIDAWCDAASGRDELARVHEFASGAETGVRMHWLFFDEGSPARLEQAGYSYDSTVGYADTVGYRAGTVQVFKPLNAERLLELPMHAMDTAMYYLSYMSLSPSEVKKELNGLVEKAVRLGGVLTINWHDRSLGPERFWDGPYLDLLEELRRRGAWMPTAGEAVAWFRNRRGVSMEGREFSEDRLQGELAAESGAESLPGLRLRTYPGLSRDRQDRQQTPAFTDRPFRSSTRASRKVQEDVPAAA